MSLSGFGQLTKEAKVMKESTPELYQAVVEGATDRWGNDHQMRLWEVNKQAKAFISIAKVNKETKNEPEKRQILNDAIVRWHVKGDMYQWDMIIWEYNKQLEAYQTMGL